MKSIHLAGLATALSVAVGCASAPVPTARMTSAEQAVQAARGAGAETAPNAEAYLTRAESQLADARQLVEEGENAEAAELLTRAEADAQLAAALSREAQQRAATDASMQRVRSMQSTPSGESR